VLDRKRRNNVLNALCFTTGRSRYVKMFLQPLRAEFMFTETFWLGITSGTSSLSTVLTLTLVCRMCHFWRKLCSTRFYCETRLTSDRFLLKLNSTNNSIGKCIISSFIQFSSVGQTSFVSTWCRTINDFQTDSNNTRPGKAHARASPKFRPKCNLAHKF
jgi:hypothetical protein